jgi:hypothetical protein
VPTAVNRRKTGKYEPIATAGESGQFVPTWKVGWAVLS